MLKHVHLKTRSLSYAGKSIQTSTNGLPETMEKCRAMSFNTDLITFQRN